MTTKTNALLLTCCAAGLACATALGASPVLLVLGWTSWGLAAASSVRSARRGRRG